MEHGGAGVRESERQDEAGGGGEAGVGDGSGGEINKFSREASATKGDPLPSRCGRGAERDKVWSLICLF